VGSARELSRAGSGKAYGNATSRAQVGNKPGVNILAELGGVIEDRCRLRRPLASARHFPEFGALTGGSPWQRQVIVVPFLSIPISGFIGPIAANSIRNTPADFDVKPDRQRQFRSRRR
jgi:hypothetical protein